MLKTPYDIDLDDKDQARCGINDQCIYRRKFEGYKNWRVVDLVITNVTSTGKEKVHGIILHDIMTRMNERIFIGKFGAMRANTEATQRYYLVEWLTKLYTMQENTVVKGLGPPHTTFFFKKLSVTLCSGI